VSGLITLEASGNNVTKVVHVICRDCEAGMIILVHFFVGHTLKISRRYTGRDFGQL